MKLQTVYDYLKAKMVVINEQTVSSYEAYTKTLKNIEQTKKQIEEMKKPKIY